MKSFVSNPILVVTCLLAFAQSLGAQVADQDGESLEVHAAMNDGVKSFKAGQYLEAAASFRTATLLAPGYAIAHLYLGTTYASRIVPDLLTPDNLQTAQSALAEFDVVLKIHPDDLIALKQQASIYRNIQKYDEAIVVEKKLVAMDPRDAEAIYTIGVIDWMRAYRNAIETLTADGVTDDGLGNTSMTRGACEKLRVQNAALVEDGIAALTRAIELKPDYSDAMQYLQLTYRRRADFACGDKTALSAELKLADQWTKKSIDTRKQAGALPQL
jgi:tetratricopeptide (TPR) repeat protein